MVSLAEARDTGASAWSVQRRGACANDQSAEASLVAVTARSNRSKADQDPAQWLPPAAGVHCRCAGEWVATKLRWNLTATKPSWPRCGHWPATAHPRTSPTSRPPRARLADHAGPAAHLAALSGQPNTPEPGADRAATLLRALTALEESDGAGVVGPRC